MTAPAETGILNWSPRLARDAGADVRAAIQTSYELEALILQRLGLPSSLRAEFYGHLCAMRRRLGFVLEELEPKK